MPAVTDATPFREVEVAQFRRDDFEDLEAWAAEMGISTNELASQIVRRASLFMSQRQQIQARQNVVPFAPRR